MVDEMNTRYGSIVLGLLDLLCSLWRGTVQLYRPLRILQCEAKTFSHKYVEVLLDSFQRREVILGPRTLINWHFRPEGKQDLFHWMHGSVDCTKKRIIGKAQFLKKAGGRVISSFATKTRLLPMLGHVVVFGNQVYEISFGLPMGLQLREQATVAGHRGVSSAENITGTDTTERCLGPNISEAGRINCLPERIYHEHETFDRRIHAKEHNRDIVFVSTHRCGDPPLVQRRRVPLEAIDPRNNSVVAAAKTKEPVSCIAEVVLLAGTQGQPV